MRDYKCNFSLRSIQQELMDAVFDDFNLGHNRVMVVSPPGSGKTACMGGIAKYYTSVMQDEVVLIISHLGLLIEQSGSSFKKFFNLDTDILRASKIPSRDARVVLSTAQSSSILDKIMYWKSRLGNKKVGLILIDEVHINSGTDRADKILESFFPDARVVGFTGTPYKSNKSMQHLFEKVSYSTSLSALIDMGILVKPVMHALNVEDKKDLEEVMSKVVNSIQSSHQSDQCVVFMRSIDDAEMMRDILENCGIKSESITSRTNDGYRDSILCKFRDRDDDAPQVLTTVDVLSVGFDAPQLQAIYMPYGTGSVSVYLQRIGRVLRTFLGKICGDIYIGGNDPAVEEGKWEKLNRKALNAGQRHNDLELDYELNQDIMSAGERTITLEKINMAKSIRKKGMDSIADQILDRSFPQEFLDHLVPFKRYQANANMSPKQAEFIQSRGIDSSGMKKNEASSVIDAISKKEGWYKPKAQVPEGKHAGTPADKVPFSYINLVSKRHSKYYNSKLADFFATNK